MVGGICVKFELTRLKLCVLLPLSVTHHDIMVRLHLWLSMFMRVGCSVTCSCDSVCAERCFCASSA